MDTDELILIAEARQAAKSGRGRRLREIAGLSQLEVAGAVGVSQAAVAKWEVGDRSPHGEPAIRWALALRAMADHVTAAPKEVIDQSN
jgi:transcriptional regulator with XRE-family HTH domain